ncbi:MAG: hypothetical protein PVI26_05465 [Chitinispirillia bacterium]|jgi:hypothetical protein
MSNNTNPFEGIIKRTELFSNEVRNIQAAFENVRKKRVDVNHREAILLKDVENLTGLENKVQSELVSLLNSISSFLQDTVSYSNELYKRNQAEIQYRTQAEAAQRALAEAAQKVVSDAAERARAEAEYRKQAEIAQKHLAEQALRAQGDAAKRIQHELSHAPVISSQYSNANMNTKRTVSNKAESYEPRHESYKPKETGKVPIDNKRNINDVTKSEVITLESITADRANRIDRIDNLL